jgi:hypothetical protein
MAIASYDTGLNGQPEELSASAQTNPHLDAGPFPSFGEISQRTNAWELVWKEISWRERFLCPSERPHCLVDVSSFIYL